MATRPNVKKFADNYYKLNGWSKKICKSADNSEDILHDTFIYFATKKDPRESVISYFHDAMDGRFKNSRRTKSENPNLHLYIDGVDREDMPKELAGYMIGSAVEQVLIKEDDQMQMEYLNSIIGKVLGRGSEQYKVFRAVMRGKTIVAISKESGDPYNTVKANFRHAMLKIKSYVKKHPLEF